MTTHSLWAIFNHHSIATENPAFLISSVIPLSNPPIFLPRFDWYAIADVVPSHPRVSQYLESQFAPPIRNEQRITESKRGFARDVRDELVLVIEKPTSKVSI